MIKLNSTQKLIIAFAIVYILTLQAVFIMPNKKNTALKEEIVLLEMNRDSLKQAIVAIEFQTAKKEQELKNQIQTTEINYQNQIVQIKKQYDLEKIRIKSLPLTEQVEMLAFNLQDVEDPILLQTINKDTSLLLTIHHAENINQTYWQLNYVSELNTLCQTSRDTLNILLSKSFNIINDKDSEIKLFKTLSSVDQRIIQDLNKTITDQRKTTRKRIWRTALISTQGGILVGTLITIL